MTKKHVKVMLQDGTSREVARHGLGKLVHIGSLALGSVLELGNTFQMLLLIDSKGRTHAMNADGRIIYPTEQLPEIISMHKPEVDRMVSRYYSEKLSMVADRERGEEPEEYQSLCL